MGECGHKASGHVEPISPLSNEYTGVSPCKICDRRDRDKNECIDTCKAIAAYRRGVGILPLPPSPLFSPMLPSIKKEEDIVEDKTTDEFGTGTRGTTDTIISHTDSDRECVVPVFPDTPPAAAIIIGPNPKHAAAVNKGEEKCAIPGCDKDACRRGLCEKHYGQWYRGMVDHPNIGKFRKLSPIELGDRKRRQYRGGGVCRIAGCDRDAVKRGLCGADYKSWIKGKILHPDYGEFFRINRRPRAKRAEKGDITPEFQKPKEDKRTDVTIDMSKYPEIAAEISRIARLSDRSIEFVVLRAVERGLGLK